MDDKLISERVMQRVLTMPEDEFSTVSVTKLAKNFQLDRFKLSRGFRQQAGMTLEEFLFKEKMTRAAFMLLAHRDISVKEVARRMGFCTCDYFIRKFRHYYGMVPGKYKAYKIEQPGAEERRRGLKDRRQKSRGKNIPGTGDRRKGPKNRRQVTADRSKPHNHHQDPAPFRSQEQDTMDSKKNHSPGLGQFPATGNGDACKTCPFRNIALNHIDAK
jgi:AraC-like DNA-binding protein